MDTELLWAGIDRRLWLDEPAASALHLDPYTVWALQTEFRSLAYTGARTHGAVNQRALPEALAFVLEHALDVLPVPAPGLDFSIPAVYAQALPDGRLPRFITLRLPTEGLTVGEVQQAVLKLLRTPGVLRLQMGTQRPVDAPAVPVAHAGPDGSATVAPWPDPPQVVLGVLDDGCPFAHAALRGTTGTRVAALWDQSLDRPAAAPWQQLPRLGYGAQLIGTDMAALMARHTDVEGLDEADLYNDPDVAMPHLAGRNSHAAAVIGLLAGHGPSLPHRAWPKAGQAPVPAEDGVSHPVAHPVDPPSSMPLVVVQLPREQVKVTSGRWLAVNALDGLHYLIDAARQLRSDGQRPTLVANMSYGGQAGAHDGTGLLESAMRALCSADPQLALVLPAGNSHGMQADVDALLPQPVCASGVHGLHILAPGDTRTFTLLAPPDKQFETYLELWFSLPDAEAGSQQPQWLEPGEVRITATSPTGQVLTAVFPDIVFSDPAPQNTVAGLICLRKVSQSRLRSMALLVTAATQNNTRRVESAAGRWEVQVTHTGTTTRRLQVDAWVERDDTTVGAVRRQAARLVANADGQSAHLQDANTLAHRSLHPRMVTAGALRNRDTGSGHPDVSAYSAAGLDNTSGPGFSALVDSDMAAPGMLVAGSQSGTVARSDGTSLAAPQVARWLAEQVAGGQSLDAVLNGPWTGRTARRGAWVP